MVNLKQKVRIPFHEAQALANRISSLLENAVTTYEVCGILRRKSRPTVGTIPIVVSDFPRAWEIIHEDKGWYGVPIPAYKNKVKRFGIIKELYPVPIQLHHAYTEEWGAMRLYLTGNFFFTIQMRSMAKKQDMNLNQYGLWFRENIIAGRTEEQIFEALGLPFITPSQREFAPRQTMAETIITL
jgi:DNA polymerase/3'-5' exonuclease PolX